MVIFQYVSLSGCNLYSKIIRFIKHQNRSIKNKKLITMADVDDAGHWLHADKPKKEIEEVMNFLA